LKEVISPGLTVPSGEHGVPRLPDGGTALGDGVEPGGAFLLQQEIVRCVHLAHGCQRVGDQRDASEACPDPVPALADELGEPLASPLPGCVVGEQIEDDGKRA
jgi:hypothetical protein